MFIKLRKLSESPLAKIFLLALALSLVIWGIKIGSGHKNYVATIGKENHITIEDFKRIKRNLLRNTNQPHVQSMENSNINQEVLKILIQNELLKAEAASLGLVIGKNVALKIIKNMPVFTNKDGKFDKNIFTNVLAMYGITASKFLDSIKDETTINILNSIFTRYFPSENLIKEFYNYKKQKRLIDLITIQVSQNSKKLTITDKDIKKYYSSYKNKFAVPESRDVEYIAITSNDYQDKIKSLKEEVNNELTNSKNTDKTNKELDSQRADNLLTNKINRLLHNEIKKIENEIAEGSSLKEIATKYKLKYQLIEKLNNNTEKNIPNFNQFLDQAFSASENYPSEAFGINKNKISSGYYILNIPKIYKSHYKPLDEERKKEIIKFIREEQTSKALQEKALKFYNLIVSGEKSLKDIIQENSNISVQEITVSKDSSNINPNLLISVFGLKNKNSYSNIFKSKESSHIFQFANVKEIQLPQQSPSADQIKIIEDQLVNFMTTAINQEFLYYLYKKHTVKIFPETLEKL